MGGAKMGRRPKKARAWNANNGFGAFTPNGNGDILHLGPATPPTMLYSDLEPQAGSFQNGSRLVSRPLLQRVAAAPGYNSLIHVSHGLANNVFPVVHKHYPQI